jgi:hypothetical protein
MRLRHPHEAMPQLHDALAGSSQQGLADGDRRPARHRLNGVRLGAVERTFLLWAPSSQALTGMLIEAPERTRSAQETHLRAARKLSSHGLAELEAVPAVLRARDPRRAKPFYRDGRFWLRADMTRRHVVHRKALWLTLFGDEIRRLFDRELRSGARIRWTDEKVRRAERDAAVRHVDRLARTAGLAQMAEDLSGSLDSDTEIPEGAVEYVPQFVTDSASLERWRSAVWATATAGPSRSSKVLLEETTELYWSTNTTLEELRARALSRPYSRRQPRFSWDAFQGMQFPRAWPKS